MKLARAYENFRGISLAEREKDGLTYNAPMKISICNIDVRDC